MAEQVVEKWRGLYGRTSRPVESMVHEPGRRVAAPLAGFVARVFLERVRTMALDISARHPNVDRRTITSVASELALRGFTQVSQLGSLSAVETSAWVRHPLAAAVLSRLE